MKLRRFTSAGVEMARQYLAAVKESNDVENVTLNGQPFTRAALISSPAYSDAIIAARRPRLGETPRPTAAREGRACRGLSGKRHSCRFIW